MSEQQDYSKYGETPEHEDSQGITQGGNVLGAEGSLSFLIPEGFYDGAEIATAQDADLVAGNVKDGVTIFNVEGTYDNSTPLTGDNFTGDDGDLTIPVPVANYPAGKIATAQDSDLVAGNIKDGVNIFGTLGTYAGMGIASIQYGSITIPAGSSSSTATITAVDTSKTILIMLGQQYQSSVPQSSAARITLTNSTTVTALRISSGAAVGSTVNFTVVEFSAGVKSVQAGTITMLDNQTQVSATITAVVVAKSILAYLGFTGNDTGNRTWTEFKRVALTNATTITATCVSNVGTNVVGFMVLEFS